MPRNGEGWDGKSIREHVESVKSEAALAVEIGEKNRDDISDLEARLAALEGDKDE